MGSVGATVEKSTYDKISEFWNELKDREYGKAKALIPKKQQDEYNDLRYKLNRDFHANERKDVFVVSSGFANNDKYVTTTAKLNAYQKLVKKEVRDIHTDLKLGIITPEQAEKELYIAKVMDATIQYRRKLLKGDY